MPDSAVIAASMGTYGGTSSTGGGGGGSAPSLPSDVTVGTPAARMIVWGGMPWWGQSAGSGNLSTQYTNGWHGCMMGCGFPYGPSGAYGGANNFQGSDASGLSGAQWNAQKAIEGAGGTVALASADGYETYLGFQFSSYQSGNNKFHPPFGSWFNATTWTGVVSYFTTLAQAVKYLSMTGMAFDFEYATWTREPGQTLAATQAEANARGYSIGQALWGTIPGLILLIYSPASNDFPPGGWANQINALNPATLTGTTTNGSANVTSVSGIRNQDVGRPVSGGGIPATTYIGDVNVGSSFLLTSTPASQTNVNATASHTAEPITRTVTQPETTKVAIDFMLGMLSAMNDLGATGRIVYIESAFYRTAVQESNDANATNQLAYFLNSQGSRAYLSTYATQPVWNYAAEHLDLAGFTWRGKDGTSYYDGNEPTDAQWVSMLSDARQYSEGTRRAEFNYDTTNGSAAPWASDESYYGTATSITGTQNGASTTPLSTVVPTLTSVSAVASGGTVTISAQAAHAYGIRCVKVYDGTTFSSANPAASYLGTMTMTFQANGGSYDTNYTSAYQQCSYAIPGSTGHWYVLEAVSIKDDAHWTEVQS